VAPTRRTFLKIAAASAIGAPLAAALWRGSRRSAGRLNVAIIGSGAAGISAATALLNEGVPVTMVDAGWWPPTREREDPPPIKYHGNQEYSWVRMKRTGGRLTAWRAHAPRFAAADFVRGEKFGSEFRYPISYADLESSYTKVERLFGVVGRAESFSDSPDGEFAGPSFLTPDVEDLSETLLERGCLLTAGRYARYPRAFEISDRGREPVAGRGAERRGKKFDGVEYLVEQLAHDENFALMGGASVYKIETGSDAGPPYTIRYVDEESRQAKSIECDVVLLGAGCIASTAILLNSKSPRFPDGLGNTSDTLGRCLHDHTYRWLHLRVDDLQHARNMYLARADKLTDSPGQFGWIGGIVGHKGSFASFGDMEPHPENRVLLSPASTETTPVVRFDVRRTPTDQAVNEAMARAGEAFCELVGGKVDRIDDYPIGDSIHYAGTCRMGDDPAGSMLGANGEMHELEKFFVIDGSALPWISEKQPTLTLGAYAWRVGEQLARRIKRSG
jgi:choline dehydrogenase-like flavoprotein